jgi:hypothetical protein
VTSSI